jgi:hypothetical protein
MVRIKPTECDDRECGGKPECTELNGLTLVMRH